MKDGQAGSTLPKTDLIGAGTTHCSKSRLRDPRGNELEFSVSYRQRTETKANRFD
jgi:hypothetical protein